MTTGNLIGLLMLVVPIVLAMCYDIYENGRNALSWFLLIAILGTIYVLIGAALLTGEPK